MPVATLLVSPEKFPSWPSRSQLRDLADAIKADLPVAARLLVVTTALVERYAPVDAPSIYPERIGFEVRRIFG